MKRLKWEPAPAGKRCRGSQRMFNEKGHWNCPKQGVVQADGRVLCAEHALDYPGGSEYMSVKLNKCG